MADGRLSVLVHRMDSSGSRFERIYLADKVIPEKRPHGGRRGWDLYPVQKGTRR